MTLASAIVRRGFRASNLVPLVGSVSTNEEAEGLALLNSFMLSALPSELRDINIGGAYDQSQFVSSWVPENLRLAVKQTAARSLSLHPQPYDGQRVAVADVGANFATYNLTLNANGRRIEAAATVVLSTNSLARQWMYRGDTGNWVRMGEMAAADTFPFPVEFDNYFGLELALLLNPQNSAAMTAESQAALRDGRTRFAARYRRPRAVQDMGSAGLLNQSESGVGFWNPLA